MKVLSVVNTLNRGGIEVQLLQSMPWLVENGVEMDICTVGPGMLDDDFRRFGCKLWRIPKSGNCLSTAKYVQGILRQRKYECIHCNLGHASGGYALGAAVAEVPIAVSLHQAKPASLRNWENVPILGQARSVWLRWHRHLMDRNAQMFVGHSAVNMNNYATDWRSNSSRYRVIMNGIDFPHHGSCRDEARELLGVSGDELLLIHVGSYKKEKNHEGLFEILQRVARQVPRVKLISIGGGGAVPTSWERQLSKMNLRSKVRFEGAKSNVWPYYAAADVFVFPSLAEGFGNVLVESQGASCPIVASDIEPHRESIAPSQQRFKFALPDYDRAAELVLEQATAAKENLNDWVFESRDYVRREFGIERFALELKKLYIDLSERAGTDLGLSEMHASQSTSGGSCPARQPQIPQAA